MNTSLMKKKLIRLDVGTNLNSTIGGFSFGGDTPKYFDEHITKSVPLYNQGHDIITKLSSFFLEENSTFYDLGCSTGTLIKKIDAYNPSLKLSIIGIDLQKKMILRAKKKNLKNYNKVNFKCLDISKIKFKKSDLITSYYTIQFLKPKNRQVLFNKVYKSLNWGGGFIFFEKVRAPDARFQDMMNQIYQEYKIDNGINEKQVINKSLSLRNVLEPYSSEENKKYLKRAGFKDFMTIMKSHSFEGFLAIK